METKPSVLLAVDDNLLSEMLASDMKINNITVKSVANGNDAVKHGAGEEIPDVVVIDANLKGLSGMEVCAILKSKPKTKNIPVILISKNGQNLEQVKGINTGIDDYLVLPFSPNELTRRIRAIIRGLNPELSSKYLEYEDIRMDLDNHKVMRADKLVRLGNIEFKILQCFLEHPKDVLSREKIIEHVWGVGNKVDARTVDVHINRIRMMLKCNHDYIPLIKTIRGMGYCLRGAFVK